MGDGVQAHRGGDRVLVPFQVSCGACPACREQRYAACHTHRAPAGAAFGFGAAGGGHGGAVADLLAVPAADHLLHPAPAGLDPVALCALPDNGVDAFRAVGPPLAAHPGADVLVVGGGAPSIGLYVVALARALGAGSVRYADRDADRCAQAERLGAQAIHHDGRWPRRFGRAPITVDNTGEADGLHCTLRSTEDYGTCTPVAIHFAPETPLPLLELYTRGITLHLGRADSRRHLATVAALAAAGRFDPLAVSTMVVEAASLPDGSVQPSCRRTDCCEAAELEAPGVRLEHGEARHAWPGRGRAPPRAPRAACCARGVPELVVGVGSRRRDQRIEARGGPARAPGWSGRGGRRRTACC